MSVNTKRLKIVHTESSCGWGGQEIRVLNEAAGMLRRGHDVTVLCPQESRIYHEAPGRGVPVVALPIGRKRIAGIRALYRWLRNARPDLVNTHSSTDAWLVALASQFIPGALPIVRTRHISAPIPESWPSRWLYGKATRHIVTTGEALRLQVIAQTGVAPANVTSVPTGVPSIFSPGDREAARAGLGLPAQAFIVGIVATLRSWKGHRYLLDAFARLADRDAHLVIVGDGPQREALARQVAELGLDGRVTMPGNQSVVLPWFHAMDLFVLPSYANEGVPQAVLQAMACGLPVVSTPIGAIGEAIADDKTGLLVKPEDAASLHDAIMRLRGDVALRERLGRGARERALSRFSEASMLDSMETVFRAATESP